MLLMSQPSACPALSQQFWVTRYTFAQKIKLIKTKYVRLQLSDLLQEGISYFA